MFFVIDMKLSREQFLNKGMQAITLMGMAGVGKTHLSALLEKEGWHRYSCDFAIGTKYMKDELAAGMISPDDVSPLSKFLGLLGNPAKGGLPMGEFRRRQKLYYDAECRSLDSVPGQIGDGNFIHDSTGSLCEIEDAALVERLGMATFFVYLKADKSTEEMIIKRAVSHPKPLFFPPSQFDGWVREYLDEHGLSAAEEIDPPDFSRWVFPKLFRSRLPKYQRLADLYGVTIEASSLRDVDGRGFLDCIAGALA